MRPFALLLLPVLAAAAWLRWTQHDGGYWHPDERITTAVVGHMRQSGDWDTNWVKADVAPDMKRDQYNFSSHLYANFLFYRVVKVLPGTERWRSADGGFWVYRFLAMALGLVAAVQTVRLAARLGGGPPALAAGTLVAACPLLVQDAHYSRPETFVTVLTLAAVAGCWPRPVLRPWAVLGAAFALGLLVACKVSLLLLAWLPLVPWWSARATAPSRRLLAAVPLVMAAGFALGAPGALAHPSAFLAGVRALTAQYAGGHPPHGHPDGRAVGDLLLRYFGTTLGWATLAAMVAGALVLVRRRRGPELVLLAGPVALFAGYFATQAVFFERNLSHIVPLALMLAGLGVAAAAEFLFRGGRWPVLAVSLAGAALLALPGARLTWRLVTWELPGHGLQARARLEEDLRARFAHAAWRPEPALQGRGPAWLREHFARETRPVLLRFTDYRDGISALQRAELAAQFRLERVAFQPSSFPGVPVCTLLTYHGTDEEYLLVTGPR